MILCGTALNQGRVISPKTLGAIEPAHIKEPLELHKELEALSPVDKQRLRMIAKSPSGDFM